MKKKSLLVTAAMATMIAATGCSSSSNSNVSADTVGKCHGVNGCGGQGMCATKGNSCKGQNSCKGHGFLKLSKGECDKLDGKFDA